MLPTHPVLAARFASGVVEGGYFHTVETEGHPPSRQVRTRADGSGPDRLRRPPRGTPPGWRPGLIPRLGRHQARGSCEQGAGSACAQCRARDRRRSPGSSAVNRSSPRPARGRSALAPRAPSDRLQPQRHEPSARAGCIAGSGEAPVRVSAPALPSSAAVPSTGASLRRRGRTRLADLPRGRCYRIAWERGRK